MKPKSVVRVYTALDGLNPRRHLRRSEDVRRPCATADIVRLRVRAAKIHAKP